MIALRCATTSNRLRKGYREIFAGYHICIYAMNRSSRNVMRKMLDVGPDSICISALVAAELAYGVARSDAAYREKNELHLQRFIHNITVVPWTHEAMWHYGEQRQRLKLSRLPISEIDLLIGAQALATDLVVVTNNVREFQRIEGLTLENWVG